MSVYAKDLLLLVKPQNDELEAFRSSPIYDSDCEIFHCEKFHLTRIKWDGIFLTINLVLYFCLIWR